jgi:hypothetical protein
MLAVESVRRLDHLACAAGWIDETRATRRRGPPEIS